MNEFDILEPQPQMRFFMNNLFMKLGFPEKNNLSRNGWVLHREANNPLNLFKGFFGKNP